MSALRSAALAIALLLGGCSAETPTAWNDLGYDRAPWVLDAVSGRQLDLRVIHGCSRMAGVDAIESEDRVEVRAWVEPDDDDRCPLVLLFTPGRVVLEAPLGARELVGCFIERSTPPFDQRASCGEIVREE
jgi:hypothetical protein